MADRNIFTRAYSSTSRRQLVSSKGWGAGALSPGDLRDEFQNHADRWSVQPTALVSTSSRIIDTVLRAFTKRIEGEDAGDIWIVFIEVPEGEDAVQPLYHHAKLLAIDCGLDERRFKYEYVFEHEIPAEYVLHRVSLETLLTRGHDWGWHFYNDNEPLATSTLRKYIRNEFYEMQKEGSHWEVGVNLGFFARAFGARAPLFWIANQLYDDCVNNPFVTDGERKLMRDGIETALIDWWLEDLGTSDEYVYFEWCRDFMEDAMMFGRLGFREAQETIEAEAVRVGL